MGLVLSVSNQYCYSVKNNRCVILFSSDISVIKKLNKTWPFEIVTLMILRFKYFCFSFYLNAFQCEKSPGCMQDICWFWLDVVFWFRQFGFCFLFSDQGSPAKSWWVCTDIEFISPHLHVCIVRTLLCSSR